MYFNSLKKIICRGNYIPWKLHFRIVNRIEILIWGQNTGAGCHSLLQGIFPTEGLNSVLLLCRQILYQLSHQGSNVKVTQSIQSMEFSRPEYWSGQSFPSPGYETMLHHSLLLSHQGPHISLPLLLLLPLHGQSIYYPHPNSHFSFETHCRCHFFGHFHTTPLPAPTTCNLVILSFGLSLSKNFDS